MEQKIKNASTLISQQSKQQREADTQLNVALLCQSAYSTNPA